MMMCEVETTSEGEFGLQKQWQACSHNRGHQNFYALENFALQHLPPVYRDEQFLSYIHTVSDLTVRVKLDSRPAETDLDTFRSSSCSKFCGSSVDGVNTGCCDTEIFASGWVENIWGFESVEAESHDRHCPCTACKDSDNPRLAWGEFWVRTTRHLFGSDLSRVDVSHVTINIELTDEQGHRTGGFGYGFRIVEDIYKHDACFICCVTHDEMLWNRLRDLYRLYWRTRGLIMSKFSNAGKLAVIVSHPHGQGKFVSIGEWTEKYNEENNDFVSWYSHTAATCPGAIAAPVIIPEREGGIILHLPPTAE